MPPLLSSVLSGLLALVFLVGLNAGVACLSPGAGLPALAELRSAPEDLVRDAGMLVLGMRRLAADFTFVQLLLYYGTPESRGEDEGHGLPGHVHRDYAAGDYAELLPRARRVLALDPRFDYAALYTAGALAFNQNRPEQALELLAQAQARAPRNWRFAAYIAAVGFHKSGDGASVLDALRPALAERDCPTMVRNMAAFLNERLGRRVEAERLYREILLSRDVSYHEVARRALLRLAAAPSGLPRAQEPSTERGRGARDKGARAPRH